MRQPFAASRKHSLCGACLLLLALGPGATRARQVSDQEIKAAMLYNFTKFVEWPPAAHQEAVTIGVAGRDPFGKILDDAVAGRLAHGKPVLIKRSSNAADLKDCQIVFISISEKKRVSVILQALQSGGVLTVSDMEDFLDHGGMIGFVLEDNRVRFEVNREAAERGRLRISARLLKLAKVRDGAGGDRP